MSSRTETQFLFFITERFIFWGYRNRIGAFVLMRVADMHFGFGFILHLLLYFVNDVLK